MKKKYFGWLFLAIIFLIPIVLYLYKFGSSTFSSKQAEWGTFGDYLGGILGVLLSAVTIYFVYKTYATQNEQLKIQSVDSTINFVYLQYDQIIKDINEISFGGKNGSDALYAWNETHLVVPNNVVNTMNFIIHTFNSHIATIARLNMAEELKNDFRSRAYLMIHSKIIWPALSKLYDDPEFKAHTDHLLDNFNDLMKKTYEYLVPRNQLLEPTDQRILAVYK